MTCLDGSLVRRQPLDALAQAIRSGRAADRGQSWSNPFRSSTMPGGVYVAKRTGNCHAVLVNAERHANHNIIIIIMIIIYYLLLSKASRLQRTALSRPAASGLHPRHRACHVCNVSCCWFRFDSSTDPGVFCGVLFAAAYLSNGRERIHSCCRVLTRDRRPRTVGCCQYLTSLTHFQRSRWLSDLRALRSVDIVGGL